MIGYRYDDGGRFWSGRFRKAEGDCVARALSILTRKRYREVLRHLEDANATVGSEPTAERGIVRFVESQVYEEFGLMRVKFPRGPKPTWTEAYIRYGDCIVATRDHVAAIRGGKVRDTFDSRWTTKRKERKATYAWVIPTEDGSVPADPTFRQELARRWSARY